ncbi:MAG: 2-oxoacid:ferredoxin oxidoreductase subunit beta [Thermodesulfobacteriota bacterium]
MSFLDKFKGQKPAWCPGCGNFAILNVLKRLFTEMELDPSEITIVSGIGQGAKTPHYTKCNTFNGLHGRTLPVATGIALANNKTHVIAIAGDGDCYGEGGNHLLHAMRRNINITLFVHNNQVYGLTKGQASPTSMPSLQSKTQPFGNPSEPLNPLALAIAMNCSFVARAFAGASGLPQLQELMKKALEHKGFAMIDILQNCVTFNKINTFHWYKERTYRLEENYDPGDRISAFSRSLEWGDKIPLGLFYKNERPVMEDNYPMLKEGCLAAMEFDQKEVFHREMVKFF